MKPKTCPQFLLDFTQLSDLQGNGLSKAAIFSHVFRAQGYSSVSDALSISIEDLEDIGFYQLGHQKRLLLGLR